MDFDIKGMSCAACSSKIEKEVKKLSGVEACAVNLMANSMKVTGTATKEEIIEAVIKAGYDASLKGEKPKKEAVKGDNIKSRIISSAVFLILLMYMAMGHNMLGLPLPRALINNPLANALIQLILSSIILLINKSFFIKGFLGLIHRAPNMDTLVALGSGASFIYSIAEIFYMSHLYTLGNISLAHMRLHNLYFESAAMILVLISVGKMLEAKSKSRTMDAINSLNKLTPQKAVIIRDGKEITVPISEIKKDDIFIVKPGEGIPADGVIIEGFTSVNESALTGESIPVDKIEGDEVRQATINHSGFIKCRALKVGEDTLFSQILKTVNDAAATKAPIARTADKISGIFVPVVLTISFITFIIWMISGKEIVFSLARAISVLVISCPCALGLATPVAITVGSGMGAKMGILFKNAKALEYTGKIKTVAFDKTGTLTKGEPRVTDIIPLTENEDDFLIHAYSLEAKSEHPLGNAVCKYAKEKKIEITESSDFEILPGSGLKGIIKGNTIYGGSFKFISGMIDISEDTKKIIEDLSDSGKTPLLFTKNETLMGIIGVSDEIRKESKATIEKLKSLGIKTVIITGDNHKTANAVKALVDADEVYSEVLPSDKANIIKSLSKNGKIAMVGDGINDSPALISADIGIAVANGSDIAIDSADILLINNNMENLPKLIMLSKKTLKIIYENLFWAFIYNIIGLPLAAGLFIPITGWELSPMFGALAMSLSSFSVVTNALRIYNFKDKKKEKKKMEITMKIEGMMCMHCEARVKKVLEGIDGVSEAIVSHEKDQAIVKMTREIPFEELKAIIENEGYKVI